MGGRSGVFQGGCRGAKTKSPAVAPFPEGRHGLRGVAGLIAGREGLPEVVDGEGQEGPRHRIGRFDLGLEMG